MFNFERGHTRLLWKNYPPAGDAPQLLLLSQFVLSIAYSYLNSLVPICTVDSPPTWGKLYQQSDAGGGIVQEVLSIVLHHWEYIVLYL